MIMSAKFEGKKLLILGSNTGSTDIVAYAKANGATTIVADYYPPKQSAAKQIADRHYLISTGDLDRLSDLINSEGIDGVIAGISEFNLLNAQKLSQSHKLPFYCTENQWRAIEDKIQFRALCNTYNVPTPGTLYRGDYRYCPNPRQTDIVVKPADSSSSCGVSLRINNGGLQHAIEIAAAASSNGQIIVEEYCSGDEFTAHYYIERGKAWLICVDNRHPATLHPGKTSIPIARTYPCTFTSEYCAQVNPQMIQLCQSLNLECAVLFVQGLYNASTHRFAIFEGGLRCAGEAAFRITAHTTGFNFLHRLVDYSLLGSRFAQNQARIDPLLAGKHCATISLASAGGEISRFTGLEGIQSQVPSIINIEQRYYTGDTVPNGDTLRQLVLRFTLVCADSNQLATDIKRINTLVSIMSTSGQDISIKYIP